MKIDCDNPHGFWRWHLKRNRETLIETARNRTVRRNRTVILPGTSQSRWKQFCENSYLQLNCRKTELDDDFGWGRLKSCGVRLRFWLRLNNHIRFLLENPENWLHSILLYHLVDKIEKKHLWAHLQGLHFVLPTNHPRFLFLLQTFSGDHVWYDIAASSQAQACRYKHIIVGTMEV